MKNNLVTKIALIVAIIALLFSIVTLVRALTDPAFSKNLMLAVVQVIGTAIIVAICGIMLYVMNSYEDDDEDEDDEKDADENEKESEVNEEAAADPAEEETTDITAEAVEPDDDGETEEDEIDLLLRDIASVDDDYDLANFE